MLIANAPLDGRKFPEYIKEDEKLNESLFEIAKYNNHNKGLFELNEFIQWAVDNSIKFPAVYWFLSDFSGIHDDEFFIMLKHLFDENDQEA